MLPAAPRCRPRPGSVLCPEGWANPSGGASFRSPPYTCSVSASGVISQVTSWSKSARGNRTDGHTARRGLGWSHSEAGESSVRPSPAARGALALRSAAKGPGPISLDPELHDTQGCEGLVRVPAAAAPLKRTRVCCQRRGDRAETPGQADWFQPERHGEHCGLIAPPKRQLRSSPGRLAAPATRTKESWMGRGKPSNLLESSGWPFPVQLPQV